MDPATFEYYAADRSRHRDPGSLPFAGEAGGAACGDLIRLGLEVEAGRVVEVGVSASGCAAARACAAAAAEILDGAPLLEAARLEEATVREAVGGLSPLGAHAASLAAEAAHRALGVAAGSGRALLNPPQDRERILVAVSGGVDSAVAALLERERGAEVVAVTLELWSDPANDGERSCCSADAVRVARSSMGELGVPHLTVDLRERFASGVVEPFLAGYTAGETPNPCIRCNGEVRIEAMVRLAERLGCAALATGHYARREDDGAGPLLRAAADPAKDQTYMLAALPAEILSKLRFPLGELTKEEVRAIASERGLGVATRRESQDLCFLSGVGKQTFLERHGSIDARRGEIVDRAGNRLGTHAGYHLFTVGQRKGIGVAAPEPLYVLETDARANRVVVGTREELLTDRVAVRGLTLLRGPSRVDSARFRYRSSPRSCEISLGPADGQATLRLAEPQARPAPGQTAVLYEGERIIGRGTIA